MGAGIPELQAGRGFLVVVSGPGGVGKNTLVNAVRARMPQLDYSVSVTTRPPRPGEQDGVHYHFVTPEAFSGMVQRGELLEWARFGDHLYGTPRAFIEQALEQSRVVLLDIDIAGARQLRERRLDAVFVFLVPPSLAALRERLARRGTDPEETIERRMRLALTELQAVADYDYVIVNASLEAAATCLESIIRAEACRPGRASIPRWEAGVTGGQPDKGSAGHRC